MEAFVQKATYSVFTIHLALIFHVYEMYRCDFILNVCACILFLAEAFSVVSNST